MRLLRQVRCKLQGLSLDSFPARPAGGAKGDSRLFARGAAVVRPCPPQDRGPACAAMDARTFVAPAGVDSLLINELVLREGELRKEKPFDLENYPVQDALARRFTTPEEYARITTPVLRPDADTLFFPGCNVYKQPEKLLAALDLLDATGRPYSFVPGLSHCCGQMPQAGRGGRGSICNRRPTRSSTSFRKAARKRWCSGALPCLVTLSARIEKYRALPFEPLSFAAYLLRYADRLHFSCAQPKTVTLHDPCKAVYMGLEQESVRKLLSLVPGTRLVEMAHHGKDALCCGCASVGAVTGTQMDVGDRVTEAPRAGGAGQRGGHADQRLPQLPSGLCPLQRRPSRSSNAG